MGRVHTAQLQLQCVCGCELKLGSGFRGGCVEEETFGIGCMNKAQSGSTTNIPSLNGAGRLKSRKGKNYLHHRGPVSPSPARVSFCSVWSSRIRATNGDAAATEERRGEERWLETSDEVKISVRKNYETTHKEAEMK